MRKRKKMYIILFALIPVLIIITIAYAALSTTLTTKWNQISVAKQTWNVGFEVNSSITATTSSTSNTGFSCGTASTTATTVTVGNISLSKPGDKCVWPVKIKNTGTITALFKSTSQTVPSGVTCTQSNKYAALVCGNITYRLTTDAAGSNSLQTNTEIAAGSELQAYVVARYNSDSLNSTQVVQSGAAITLVYEQK